MIELDPLAIAEVLEVLDLQIVDQPHRGLLSVFLRAAARLAGRLRGRRNAGFVGCPFLLPASPSAERLPS